MIRDKEQAHRVDIPKLREAEFNAETQNRHHTLQTKIEPSLRLEYYRDPSFRLLRGPI